MNDSNHPLYVTVMPAAPRSGWMVAHRDGSTLTHTRLDNASIRDPEAARAQAQAMYPNHTVVMPDDAVKPWKVTADAA